MIKRERTTMFGRKYIDDGTHVHDQIWLDTIGFKHLKMIIDHSTRWGFYDLYINKKRVENFDRCIEIEPDKKLKNSDFKIKDYKVLIQSPYPIPVWYAVYEPNVASWKMVKAKKIYLDFRFYEVWIESE